MTARTTRWEDWMGVLIALAEDGMTQKELAEKLGWDPSKLSRILAGVETRGGKRQELKFHEVVAIAKAQDRPIDWYIEGPGRGRGVYVSSFSHAA